MVPDFLTHVYLYGMLFNMVSNVKTKDDETNESSEMAQLLSKHEELVEVPSVGDILTGSILERSSNSMYIDLGNPHIWLP